MVQAVDHDGLAQLQRQFMNLDVGDRIMNGRLQLFSLQRPDKGVLQINGNIFFRIDRI